MEDFWGITWFSGEMEGGGERVSRRQYSRRREGTIDYLLMKGNHT